MSGFSWLLENMLCQVNRRQLGSTEHGTIFTHPAMAFGSHQATLNRVRGLFLRILERAVYRVMSLNQNRLTACAIISSIFSGRKENRSKVVKKGDAGASVNMSFLDPAGQTLF